MPSISINKNLSVKKLLTPYRIILIILIVIRVMYQTILVHSLGSLYNIESPLDFIVTFSALLYAISLGGLRWNQKYAYILIGILSVLNILSALIFLNSYLKITATFYDLLLLFLAYKQYEILSRGDKQP